MKLNLLIIATIFFLGNISYSQTDDLVINQLISVNQLWEDNSFEHPVLDTKINFSEDTDLIKLHLSLIEQKLRQNTPESLTSKQKENRFYCLEILNKYWNNGIFPINLYHQERTPYFIDHLGTACAVGHLINETGFTDVSSKISKENNYGYVLDLVDEYNEIEEWADVYGFTADELAWIQPGYPICEEGCYFTLFVFAEVPDDTGITFHWEPGGIESEIFENACSNVEYTVTATDSLGQPFPSEDLTIMMMGQAVVFPNVITIPYDGVEADVFKTNDSGSCNGAAVLTPTSNNGPYTYQWSNGEVNQSVDSLCTGTHSVIITGEYGSGCSEEYQIVIAYQPIDEICNPDCNISLSAIPQEGEPPYQYLWEPSEFAYQTIQGLCPGSSVACTIVDNQGDTLPEDKVLILYQGISFPGNNFTIPETIEIETSSTFTNDGGDCNGTAQLTASGGDAPYNYEWESEEISNNFISNLCQGTYVYSVTDQNGCETTDSLYIDSQELEIICDYICNQEVSIVAIDNNNSYQYLWSPSGQTGTTASGLCPGETYSCLVTDTLGNTVSEENFIIYYQNLAYDGNSMSLPVSEQINITFETTLDNGNCNGTATVIASNGTPPYYYSWEDQGQITDTITNLCFGDYSVMVSDLNCSSSANINIGTNVGITSPIKDDFDLKISPNPTNKYLTISYVIESANLTANIYDCTGKKIMEANLQQSEKTIDVSQLPSGIYFLTIKKENLFSKMKFIKN